MLAFFELATKVFEPKPQFWNVKYVLLRQSLLHHNPVCSPHCSYLWLAFLYVFLGLMFHLVFAASMVLTLFLFSHRRGPKGKWGILSVQTPMLWKTFNSSNLTNAHCKAVKLSCWAIWRASEEEGNADAITVSLCRQRTGGKQKTGSVSRTEKWLCCDANNKSLSKRAIFW